MVKGIHIKRILAAYDGVNLVFGVGIEPHLEMSNRIVEKSGYKLETEEDRRNAILNVYKNGYLPKYIYSELSACMNGKEKDVCDRKDIEFLYTVAKKVYIKCRKTHRSLACGMNCVTNLVVFLYIS